MILRLALGSSLLLLLQGALLLAYEIRVLQIRPASDYAAHQEFQNLVIGAYPADTEEKVDELFDTDKLLEYSIVPILLVVDNKNSFPVSLYWEDIFLLDSTGERIRPLDYRDLLLEINGKKGIGNFPSEKQLVLEKAVDKKMLLDFEHKSLVEKLIEPGSSDHGILFYRMPESGSLEGSSLYLPEVTNASDNSPLMFFEFELK